jgi:hypothetical protein
MKTVSVRAKILDLLETLGPMTRAELRFKTNFWRDAARDQMYQALDALVEEGRVRREPARIMAFGRGNGSLYTYELEVEQYRIIRHALGRNESAIVR